LIAFENDIISVLLIFEGLKATKSRNSYVMLEQAASLEILEVTDRCSFEKAKFAAQHSDRMRGLERMSMTVQVVLCCVVCFVGSRSLPTQLQYLRDRSEFGTIG